MLLLSNLINQSTSFKRSMTSEVQSNFRSSVPEPHNFYAAPAPSKKFDAAPAPTTAHTLLLSNAKFLKQAKV
jgi:hypothetical protein